MLPKVNMTKNGHAMSIMFFSGMGGELEEYFLWCHTCDKPGEDFIARIDFYTWPLSTDEAVLELFILALEHADDRLSQVGSIS